MARRRFGCYVAARKGFCGEDLDVEINFAQSGPAVAQHPTAAR